MWSLDCGRVERKETAMPELTLRFCDACLDRLAGDGSRHAVGEVRAWEESVPGMDYAALWDGSCDGCGLAPT